MKKEKDINYLFRRAVRFLMYAGIFNFLSDEQYVSLLYWARLNKKLDLNHVRTFNEKLQWLKCNDHNEKYKLLADKYELKEIAKREIGPDCVFPALYLWDNPEQIDFDILPSKYVIKCTHDSGGLVICSGRGSVDKKRIMKKLKRCMRRNYYYHGREWPYKFVKPRIIAEDYMVDESGTELKDYKVFLFNGKPEFIEVDYNRFSGHKRNFYSVRWEYKPFTTLYPTDPSHKIPKPVCLDEMLQIAVKMGEIADRPAFLRVDFYIVRNKPYLGEVTFYHGTGCEPFLPEEWDLRLGEKIRL